MDVSSARQRYNTLALLDGFVGYVGPAGIPKLYRQQRSARACAMLGDVQAGAAIICARLASGRGSKRCVAIGNEYARHGAHGNPPSEMDEP